MFRPQTALGQRRGPGGLQHSASDPGLRRRPQSALIGRRPNRSVLNSNSELLLFAPELCIQRDLRHQLPLVIRDKGRSRLESQDNARFLNQLEQIQQQLKSRKAAWSRFGKKGEVWHGEDAEEEQPKTKSSSSSDSPSKRMDQLSRSQRRPTTAPPTRKGNVLERIASKLQFYRQQGARDDLYERVKMYRKKAKFKAGASIVSRNRKMQGKLTKDKLIESRKELVAKIEKRQRRAKEVRTNLASKREKKFALIASDAKLLERQYLKEKEARERTQKRVYSVFGVLVKGTQTWARLLEKEREASREKYQLNKAASKIARIWRHNHNMKDEIIKASARKCIEKAVRSYLWRWRLLRRMRKCHLCPLSK